MIKDVVIRTGFVLVLSVVLSGCLEMDLPPAGSYSTVLLVTDEGAEDPLARAIAPHLTKMIDYYIGEEPAFRVEHIRAADLLEVPATKNILICGVADPLTDVGSQIVSQLGSAAVEQVKAGRANIFKRENLPGPGQLTLIVTAGSREELVEIIDKRGDEVVETLEESCRNRIRRYLLKYKDEQLTKRLFETYGFVIEVPTLYTLLSEEPNPPGIELLREAPARLLGVFWLDWDHELTLDDAKTVYDARASYVWERYDKDVMDSTRVEYKLTRLAEYPALEMKGYWSSSHALAGGYYMTYFVYAKREKLLWALDLLVFAPGLPKHPHFRELRALAETFRYD